MRIIVTSPNWTLNGVNAFNATLVRGLRARGHEVTLLLTGSMWRDDKPLPVPDDLAVANLALPSVATWPARWEALQRYLEGVAPCLYLPNHDIAHSGISPALTSRVGILGIAHSDDPQHYDHARRLAPWWNGVVGVSETIVRSLGALAELHATPVTHIAYGVDVCAAADVSKRAQRVGASGEPLRMLYAGRLEERQKRASDLVAIARALRARAVAFELTIAGDGPSRAHLASAVREAQLDDVVRLVGTMPLDRMAALYRAHHVFLLPSAFEGLPLALLESMGQGCVPVVSDIASGVPELVRDGEIGYRVAIGDVEAFAERLAALARDAGLRDEMSTRARDAIARGPYGIGEMVDRYERLLGDIWSDVTSGRYVRRAADTIPPPGLDWRAHVRAPLAALRDRQRGGADVRVHAFARRFPSLSQTFVLNQCTGLIDLGVDLTVFADGADSTGRSHPDVVDSGITRRVRHYAIPEPWSRRPLPALQLMTSSSSLPVRQRLQLLAPWRGGREAASGRLLFEGAAVARERPAAILHAHFGPVGAMVDALRDAGVVTAPLVTSFYGYDVSRTPASRYRGLFRNGDAFLVLSEAMRVRLLAMGAPAERVFVHRLGVDLTRFAPAADTLPNVHGERHLLSIARLVPKKGIADALHAVARARASVPAIRYTIIGDGPLRAELERLATSLGVADVVRFAGWMAQQDVLAVARTAHALLAPSVTAPDGDAEGTPVAILEAQALALPVVATRHAGIPEVVVDGESALLVDEHDVEALASAIVTLADPQVARRMGVAGRALVERQHDIRRLNRELLARFELLASR